MATIVKFKPAGGGSRDATTAAVKAQCEIILFPGVRYERWETTPPPQPVKTGGEKKQRREKRELELAD